MSTSNKKKKRPAHHKSRTEEILEKARGERVKDNAAARAKRTREEVERKRAEGVTPVVTPSPGQGKKAARRARQKAAAADAATAAASGSDDSVVLISESPGVVTSFTVDTPEVRRARMRTAAADTTAPAPAAADSPAPAPAAADTTAPAPAAADSPAPAPAPASTADTTAPAPAPAPTAAVWSTAVLTAAACDTALPMSDTDTDEKDTAPAPAPAPEPHWDLVPDTWDAPIYTNTAPPEEVPRAVVALDDLQQVDAIRTARPTASLTFVLLTEVAGSTTPCTVIVLAGQRVVHKAVHTFSVGSNPPSYTPLASFDGGSEVVYVSVKADSVNAAKARVRDLVATQGVAVEEQAIFRPKKIDGNEPRARHWSHEVGLRLPAASVHAVLRASGDGCMVRTTERRGGYTYVPIVAEGRAEAFQLAKALGGLSLGVAHRKGWTVRCLPETEQRLREALAKQRTKRRYLLTGAPLSVTRAAFDGMMDHIGWKPSSIIRRSDTAFQGTRQLVFFIVADAPPPKARTWLFGSRLVRLHDAEDHPSVTLPPRTNKKAPPAARTPVAATTAQTPTPAPGPTVQSTGLPSTNPWSSPPSSVAPPPLGTVTPVSSAASPTTTPPRDSQKKNPAPEPEVPALLALIQSMQATIDGLQATVRDLQEKMAASLGAPAPSADGAGRTAVAGKGKGGKAGSKAGTKGHQAQGVSTPGPYPTSTEQGGGRGRAQSLAGDSASPNGAGRGRAASVGPAPAPAN